MTPDPLGVRAAAAAIVAGAVDVQVGDLEPIAERLLDRPVPAWDGRRHYRGPRLVEYIVVLDTINFSFWGGDAGGYWQLAERLRDAFEAGSDLWRPERLAALSAAELGSLIGPFPMLEERAAALRALGEIGRPLSDLVAGTAVDTARGLASTLSSFADVPFYKRAQILPADLWGAGVANFPDLASLTCFADYKLPQLLRHHGGLIYSDELARMVDDWVELPAGGRHESEIRAGTVVAVERLRDRLESQGRKLMAIEVDWMLWDWSQGVFPIRPYHRTRTVYY